MKGEIIVIDDVQTDKRIQYRDEAIREGIVSMLVVRIKAKDDVIGIMRLCSAVKRFNLSLFRLSGVSYKCLGVGN
jgi:hypothetical protein